MTTIRVWAPKPQTVELDVGGRRLPMVRDADGWWSGSIDYRSDSAEAASDSSQRPGPGVTGSPPADAGAFDYGFVLDGVEPVLPDPRSAWQPSGVHGRSRLVDHALFAWTDGAFRARPLADAILYELHVGTFSAAGTFDGAIPHFDHLVELGITHIELMPVGAFPGDRGWGYDGVDLFAPHRAYGGPDGLKRLVDAAHARGLAVLLDVVYNHLGPEGNYLSRFGPYFTDVYATPWGAALNFDQRGSDEVRQFVVDNATMWLRDYHVDGLRLDAVDRIVDNSAVHILEQLAIAVRGLETEIGRPLVLIAESDTNDPRLVRPVTVGGYGLDAQWLDDFHHALHAVLTRERSGYYADFGRIADLAKSLCEGYVYDGRWSGYRGRSRGRPATGVPGDRFVAFLQNHDQVGNRTVGHRTSHLLEADVLRIGSALVLLSPFVPLLFQGEDWGTSSPFLFFTDYGDPALAAAVWGGRRRELAAFGWDPTAAADPQAPATFQRSKLAWDEIGAARHADLLAWHRRLIDLRIMTPELRNGRLDAVDVAFDEEARWLTVGRGPVFVAVNFGDTPRALPIHAPQGAVARGAAAGSECLLLASSDAIHVGDGLVQLPPRSVAVLRTGGEPGPSEGAQSE